MVKPLIRYEMQSENLGRLSGQGAPTGPLGTIYKDAMTETFDLLDLFFFKIQLFCLYVCLTAAILISKNFAEKS